jgi:peptide/nickel transport system permease protein
MAKGPFEPTDLRVGPPPVDDEPVGGGGNPAWVRRKRSLLGAWHTYRRSPMGMTGLVIMAVFALLAVFGPLLVDPANVNPSTAPGQPFEPPPAYLLGTDNFGRPVLALLVDGARVSLVVGFAATVMTMVIGASVGIAGGYLGGKADGVLSLLTNWFLVIPWVVLAIVLAAVLGPTLLNIIVVIGITSWAGTARLVRADTLSVKERPYVERSRALGASHWHLVTRHILPNVFPVIFANTILTVALAILAETTLSLLGLGDPTRISWGGMIDEAFSAGALSAGYWWWLIPPGVMIVLVVLAFTMCGYALDEVINPKLRSR